MKTPILYLRDSADLDAFLVWAALAHIPYSGYKANDIPLRSHILAQMAKQPQVAFVTDPPGRAFAVVSRRLIDGSPSFTPLNSLSHLKSYLAKQTKRPS